MINGQREREISEGREMGAGDRWTDRQQVRTERSMVRDGRQTDRGEPTEGEREGREGRDGRQTDRTERENERKEVEMEDRQRTDRCGRENERRPGGR
ncbi:hypothetical protein RRG08_003016 [Elysia crispata]|uniref:Uncharacterized protein n=1 Tax=Elysia crispata TaxID=231223 RepID=A0AAE0ZWV5_9GAST|nr:hypothetical protein RRG08_003016 [Elysia crispata]